MTQSSPQKGPGYVLTLLVYNIPSKKGQATHTTLSKKDQATT